MALTYWAATCTAFTAADFKFHKKQLQDSKVENTCTETQLYEYVACIQKNSKCDPLAVQIITEDYPLEHKSNEATFYYKVFPFLAFYPPSFEAALPTEHKWSQMFTLIDFAGEMALKGTRFKTYGNINLETGEILFRTDNLPAEKEPIFTSLNLIDKYRAAKVISCTHTSDKKEDCKPCFQENGGGLKDEHYLIEQVYRRDLRNAYVLKDLQALKYLLQF